ncbi:3'-5' exoribonuclease HELZ2-like isoform X2 [Asterias amurensis]|uniref:3'-5' exoribonuclease HELZ2-like isoform X2 n=1 Tax=Asterias amurensis TaxID=7602 RepID=UPI003AB50B19
MSEMDEERTERQQSIDTMAHCLMKLEAVDPIYLPPGTVLNKMVREFQNLAKDEAKDLMVEENYIEASEHLGFAINIRSLLHRGGYECHNRIDMKLFTMYSHCTNKLGRPEEAFRMAVAALAIDANYLPAKVEEVKAMYILTIADSWVLPFEFAVYVQSVSAEVKEHPEIAAIIRQIEGPLRPKHPPSVAKIIPHETKPSQPHVRLKNKKTNGVPHQPKKKKRLVKEICDGKEPEFPIEPPKIPSTSPKESSPAAAPKATKGSAQAKPGKSNGEGAAQKAVVPQAIPQPAINRKTSSASSTSEIVSPKKSKLTANVQSTSTFHHQLQYLCGTCLTTQHGKVVKPLFLKGGKTVCAGPYHHPWDQSKAVAINSTTKSKWCIVKARPPSLHLKTRLVVCDVKEPCNRPNCSFPHSKEELQLWNYMEEHKIGTLDGVLSKLAACTNGTQSSKVSNESSPAAVPKATKGSSQAIPGKSNGEGAVQKSVVTKSPPVNNGSETSSTSTSTTVSSKNSKLTANVQSRPNFHHPLKYLCAKCLTTQRGKDFEHEYRNGGEVVCAGPYHHPWDQCKAVAIYSMSKTKWCIVKARPLSLHPKLRLVVCAEKEPCYRPFCTFPHSEEELQLWNYMEEHKIRSLNGVLSTASSKMTQSSKVSEIEVQNCTSPSEPSSAAVPNAPSRPAFHHRLQYLCGTCLTTQHGKVEPMFLRPGEVRRCAGPDHHPWDQSKVVAIYSTTKKKWCIVKARPFFLRRNLQLFMCNKKEPCSRPNCSFPHSEEELQLWKYMEEHTIQTLNGVLSIMAQSSRASRSSSISNEMPSVSNSITPPPTTVPLSSAKTFAWSRTQVSSKTVASSQPTRTPSSPASFRVPSFSKTKNKTSSGFYKTLGASKTPDTMSPSSTASHLHCSYCNITYKESLHLDQHTLTPEHMSKVNSDTEKAWRHRDPPWNIVNGKYLECQDHKKGSCMFSDSAQNNCTKAHSLRELEEWRERHQYRMMKMKKAKEQKLFKLPDQILKKYNSPSGADLIADELPGVQIKCEQEISQFLSTTGTQMDSTYSFKWTFLLKTSTKIRLKQVLLLYDEHRTHFRLSKPARETNAQLCPGNLVLGVDRLTYDVDVIFRSKVFGSFNQWVVFDIGTEPYLTRKLQVHIGSNPIQPSESKRNQVVELWDRNNLKIVAFTEDDYAPTNHEKKLMAKYQIPTSLDTRGNDELGRGNYKENMHTMLYLEERECNDRVSKFTTESRMKCLKGITIQTLDSSLTKYASGDMLFALVDLKSALMDDSETSQIINRKVNKMLIKFTGSNKIYEALILRDQNELGRSEHDSLYLQLSTACVTKEKLQSGAEYDVQIQLQINRLPFCYMHSAVGNLQNMDMVFPPKDKPHIFPTPDSHDTSGDRHQQRAGRFIEEHGGAKAQRMSGVGPLLVYGPFGTGKTRTLAKAVINTLRARPDCKILICTYTNSAADLYITQHFDEFVGSNGLVKMARVYAKYRPIKTIPETARKYAFITDGAIRNLTANEIKASSIVITTITTSHKLSPAKLKGHFTHILIDEAGHALETETLQPLTLATGDTCVVLAGDHVQMSQKVFSRRARQAKFNMSLLERLFYMKVGRILLHSNYRTNQDILNFISRAFYLGTSAEKTMTAVIKHEPFPGFKHPLLFCTVKGQDQPMGASYINQHEVDQLVVNVQFLHNNWPEEKWGAVDKNSIAIVTPYKMQVNLIRQELRKVRLHHIDVGIVENVQGRQFRVLVISTVRTRSTLNKTQMTTYVSSISPATRPDEIYDYGFLSDHRLLNTTMTRAQSLVMVVGDPTALCSEGECSQTWRKYLEKCEEKGTLFPTGTTVEGIRQELEAAKQQLNPDAPVFQPGKKSKGKSSSMGDDLPIKKKTYQIEDDFWTSEDDKVLPDGILKELYKQIVDEEQNAGADSEKVEDGDIRPNGLRRRKAPKFRMVEENDRIVLAFDNKDTSEEDDGVLRNDMHDEKARQTALNQVKEHPDRFKTCSFRCEQTGLSYAIPLDEDSSGKISITSKRRRGRALNMDEVIVEVLEDQDNLSVPDDEKKKLYGQVICILKRAPKSSVMMRAVCKLDEHKSNRMVPIDRTLPKFFIMSEDNDLNKKNTGPSPDFVFVTIYRHNRETHDLQVERNVTVSRRDRPHKLFIVEYVKWLANAPFPVGVVTEELLQGNDKETGLRILKLLHGVKDNWKPSTLEELQSTFPNKWAIPDVEINRRFDARPLAAFTIDPPGCRDIDDALTVHMVDGNYQVGIHIADVSFFVSKDSSVDKEAKSRATSFYSSLGDPINMLPPQLSNKFCSLLPGVDRLTISVFVTLDKSGAVVGEVNIVRSVIQSRIQMTYEDAEEIIKRNGPEEKHNTIQEKILILSNLAQERRRARLGIGSYAFSHDSEEEELLHPLSHSMVEEMMLLANETIARFVATTDQDCAPLRRQLPPSEEAVTEWLSKHGRDRPNSVDLHSRTLPVIVQNEEANDVTMIKEKWRKLRDLVICDGRPQMSKIVDLICSDENHPQLAVARTNFFLVQETAGYIRSGELPDDKRGHYSLGMPTYTHFTSPIRRYFDLVVHRILITMLTNKNAIQGAAPIEPPYVAEELELICHHCNNQAINSKRFQKETLALNFALKLEKDPQTFQVFVSDVSDMRLDLMFPYRRFIPWQTRRLALKLLKPKSKPEIDDTKTKLELNWKERIFEMHGSTDVLRPIPHGVMYNLDKEKMVAKVPNAQWQQILVGIQEDRPDLIQNAVLLAEREQQLQERMTQMRRHTGQNLPIGEITCEKADASPALSVNFMRTFERGDVVNVQLHAITQSGILMPSVQLFALTPKLHLCTEHRGNAIECFSEVAKFRADVITEDIALYKSIWLPILKMAAAHNTVQEGGSSVVQYVDVTWERIQKEDEPSQIKGLFVMTKNFCNDRNLSIHSGDYLCIRYTNLPLIPEVNLQRRLDMKKRGPTENKNLSEVYLGKSTFVVHTVVDVEDVNPWTDDWILNVQVKINQHSTPFPEVLLRSKKRPRCTIELLSKATSDRRVEQAIENLDQATSLVHGICLHDAEQRRKGRDSVFRRLIKAGRAITSFDITDSPFPHPNDSQKDALRLALQQEFTIIQGPPGTGKTVTGAHLAHFFSEVNKTLPDSGRPPQVLYCGPSNKSVDVVAHYLIRLGVSVIRVCNRRIEEYDFPIPDQRGTTDGPGSSSQEVKMDPSLQQIALHHLIRRKTNSFSHDINSMYRQFHTADYSITFEDLDVYYRLIRKAEEQELPKYKVVLCTCNEAGSKRIEKFVNAIQCIVDEAGMCNEPETLVPLVGTSPLQIVLIGDHKQLRPIIQERTAVQLGMGISLLEKYQDLAQMLTIQYRMHESICEFPSREFYSGKLETADSVTERWGSLDIWPGGRDNPLVFCHHIGLEETLSVRTDEGSEQSKANLQEVQHVVRMATALVRRHHVRQADVVVLTQYRLQKFHIEKELEAAGLEDVNVSTVVKSQGNEWDYVILSTVRSLPRVEIDERPSVAWKKQNLGFITDENQTNVAITRPRLGLIILGNKFLLQTDHTWKDLTRYYSLKGALMDAKNFLPA